MTWAADYVDWICGQVVPQIPWDPESDQRRLLGGLMVACYAEYSFWQSGNEGGGQRIVTSGKIAKAYAICWGPGQTLQGARSP